MLAVVVSPANLGDRDGAVVLLARAHERFARLRHVWADQGYRGQEFLAWIHSVFGMTVQVVRRRDASARTWAPNDAPPTPVSRVAVVPRRWVVERSFAWLGRYRRLAKEYEYLVTSSENVVWAATTLLLVRRLGNTRS